jgi:hypothetical protein
MATNPSFTKRQKEQARLEKQKEKEAKRKLKKDEKPTDRPNNGEDPDIAGIIPGPQPIPE